MHLCVGVSSSVLRAAPMIKIVAVVTSLLSFTKVSPVIECCTRAHCSARPRQISVCLPSLTRSLLAECIAYTPGFDRGQILFDLPAQVLHESSSSASLIASIRLLSLHTASAIFQSSCCKLLLMQLPADDLAMNMHANSAQGCLLLILAIDLL